METTTATSISIEKISRTKWLIRQDRVLSSTDGESVSFSVVVPISELSVGDLQQQAIRRAVELLSDLLKPVEN